MNKERPDNATEFHVYGIIPYDRVNGSYSLILKDNEDLGQMVSIMIGSSEAQSIAIFLEGVEMERPFTHDLICNLLMDRLLDVEYVVIDDSHEQTYFASMVFSDGVIADCRPSDGISIAIRLGSPIFISNDIVDAMSFDNKGVKGMDKSSDEKKEPKKKAKKQKAPKEKPIEGTDPHELLRDAIEREDYELAAKIRDQIARNNGL